MDKQRLVCVSVIGCNWGGAERRCSLLLTHSFYSLCAVGATWRATNVTGLEIKRMAFPPIIFFLLF